MRKKIISVVCFLLAVFVSHGIAADSASFFFLQFFLDKYRPMVYSTVVYKFHINIQSASKEDPSFGERGNSGEIPGRSGHCNQGVKHNKSIVCPQHMRRNVER